MKGVNLIFAQSKFYGIMGKVGSGKSSLFGAILREMPYCRGKMLRKGSVAFVEQEPVIFSTTIKENIVFGSHFDSHKYLRILGRCCLKDDLEEWKDGDETLIGERGLTLSGGQKARLALARALYADADIYLLDDPLSAVDAKVGRALFESLMLEIVGKKTVILATHQIHFLSQCDSIISLENGEIKDIRSPK